MSHYFSPDQQAPEQTRLIEAEIFGRRLEFETAAGVFSASRLDPGTAVLLRHVSPPTGGRVLDLGCGFGAIAVGLAVASPTITVDAVDVNPRATWLTARNAERAGVAERVRAFTPDEVPAHHSYDEMWSNPPIRIGKPALHELLQRWLPRLSPEGSAYLVVGKNLGADSLAVWLTEQGWPTLKLASSKGFRVLRCQRAY